MDEIVLHITCINFHKTCVILLNAKMIESLLFLTNEKMNVVNSMIFYIYSKAQPLSNIISCKDMNLLLRKS